MNSTPAPFNKFFNPLAIKASRLAVQRMEEDGIYENTTQQERDEKKIYQKYYESTLLELEVINLDSISTK